MVKVKFVTVEFGHTLGHGILQLRLVDRNFKFRQLIGLEETVCQIKVKVIFDMIGQGHCA